MNEEIEFILKKLPIGLIIFNRKSIFYTNKKANSFLSRFELPAEITTIKNRIFDAIDRGRLNELFPGEIYLAKKFNDSLSHWIFRIYIYDKPDPLGLALLSARGGSGRVGGLDTSPRCRAARGG